MTIDNAKTTRGRGLVARGTIAVALCCVAPMLWGCGGDSGSGPVAPGSEGAQGVPGASGMPGTPGAGPNAMFGMSDDPSSSGMDGNRPKMNDAALAYYQQGMQFFVAGDMPNAKTSFTQATKEDPKAHQAFYSLGVVQERLDESGAASSYRQAFKLVPDYEPALVAYGMNRAKNGKLSEADSFLTEQRGKLPDSAAVAAALAEVKSLQGDTGSAQELAQASLKINPDYKPAMVVIARDHYRHRRLDQALYTLKAILDGFEPVEHNPPRDPDNAEALLIRGLIFREQGKRAAAMDQLNRAVQRRPDLVEARVALATYLLEAGDAAQALPLLEGAVLFDQDHLPARLNLGDAYRLGGRYPEAIQQFEWVLKKDSSVPQAHYNLGLLYLFAPQVPGMTPLQQIKKAEKSLEKYQELRPKGSKDDSDELLQRANLKKAELEAQQAAAAPPAEGG